MKTQRNLIGDLGAHPFGDEEVVAWRWKVGGGDERRCDSGDGGGWWRGDSSKVVSWGCEGDEMMIWWRVAESGGVDR
ncbi:hypothetical protein Tco_0157395, partial [Tanacetum coccineum]